MVLYCSVIIWHPGIVSGNNKKSQEGRIFMFILENFKFIKIEQACGERLALKCLDLMNFKSVTSGVI